MRDIEKHKVAKRAWYMRNKEISDWRNKTGSKRMREKNQAYIIEAKNKPCMDCGMSHPSYVMDFDHRDRKEKFRDISDLVFSYGFKRLMAEIMKCDVICANCHRERTHRDSRKTDIDLQNQ